MFKNKLFVLSLAGCLTVGLVQTDDLQCQKTWAAQILGSIGQSRLMHSYSNYVQTAIDGKTQKLLNYGDQLASEKYQEIGAQAQRDLGVASEHQLPIRKINPMSPIAATVGAVAESNAIYINEEKLDARTYGQARAALYHEAVHVKYHDKATDSMLEWATLIGTSIGTYAILKACHVVAWRKRLSCIAGVGLACLASRVYHQFMERRADTQGHYATQCSMCVREHAQRRKELFEEQNNPLKDHGYLWSADLEKIAQDLGDKTCAYHPKNTKSGNEIL